MLNQPDFLRHVASKILSPLSIDSKRLDEARRILGEAEVKYNFSSYGGNPKKLIDFLLSPDFTELSLILGPDVTKKLLEAIKDNYTDEDIKKVADKMLEEINGYTENTEESNVKVSVNKKYLVS
ncbi:conserved hypothetical protein [Sulfolobus islandicus Y.G.57.14]|jgi:hypothetical protein|uniref:Uncharacterized protein n=7 Tax=Saccharolobus islandicus TaxID=43080 RepID=C3MPY5_SACI2|nr:hypothetical protein [Sulfolobus islandicus]ACP35448.1 conserved hypothetical protein [Sulfolobus islandicus L.S.2.15]ACP38107.1 conserved hypothetical protein [Sulfolobus islandicus M.14.25]ACP45614.1 conserved hypothetical protein [Sulfolobus islandicus Y.G.57.14]ACP48598.1 conserved hypothetical protein [Sulfolobus islandicus Y.N.15.51]ACP55286.1 conserved hypothetical protein [Sulfolobus islandicus M.16.27]